jgi:hypothetical protein
LYYAIVRNCPPPATHRAAWSHEVNGAAASRLRA